MRNYPNIVVAHPICLTVVFSRHLKRWWCCSSKTSSLKFSSKGKPAALAAILASAAFFLDTNAAPEVAFAIWMRASRAFCNHKRDTYFDITYIVFRVIYFSFYVIEAKVYLCTIYVYVLHIKSISVHFWYKVHNNGEEHLNLFKNHKVCLHSFVFEMRIGQHWHWK